MADISELNTGVRVRCIFKQSPFYRLVGTMVSFEHDGWIRVVFDGDETIRTVHPNDVEIVTSVECEQCKKLNDKLSTFRNQVIGLYRRCMDITNADANLREAMFIGGLNYICNDIPKEKGDE